MRATKYILTLWPILGVLFGCGKNEGMEPIRYLYANPKKLCLELLDSLITHGEHRKAIPMIEGFQQNEKEEIYLLQSEVLMDQALDSLYGE